MGFTSRMPRDIYDAIDAISITRLKELRRSAQHYRYRLQHPRTTESLTLGTACHAAVLEPERFDREFAVWKNRTEAGAMSPRRGKAWDEFCVLNAAKTIITLDEQRLAQDIACAVRGNPLAMRYLSSGEPELTMEWVVANRAAKGRIDWLTRIDAQPVIVGLKSSRDCRHFAFGSQAAKLGYHLQWAYYFDGYEAVTHVAAAMVEIVVESEPPHAVAVYRIPNDVIQQGRAEYEELLEQLARCEADDAWPGPQTAEEDLTLPSWAYPVDDDVAGLGLEWTP